MQIVRTIVWVLLLFALLAFSFFNWKPVEVQIWSNTVLETKLPALVVISFLLGLLPVKVPGTLTLAEAFFVLALAPEFYAPMRRLAAAYHEKQAAEVAADRLSALEALAKAPAAQAAPLRQAPAIRFRDVTVRYPGEDRPAAKVYSEFVGFAEAGG